MGEVYRARDTRLAREVALKRLSDAALASDVARRRVLREARAAAALSHPGIAAVYDVLDTPEGLVIVMEYVPGETLAARLSGGALPMDDALDIAAQVANALAHAHEKGVVHRDLKPANVHLTPSGRAKILDFGIAKSAAEAAAPQTGEAEPETATGRIVGSPGYMAPEQVTGRPSDRRTDVYAAGVLLFEMLTGSRPYAAADRLGTALALLDGAVPRVDERASHVPRNIADLVARAMARAPEDRFPTAAALGAAIEEARHELSNAETGVGPIVAPGRRYGWRGYRTAVIGAGTSALIVAGLIFLWTQVRSSPLSAHSSVVGVIPFRNAGSATDDPLVAGLSDAVVKRLSSVRSLRVLPLDDTREAARTAKGSSGIARAVGAAFVVEGVLQRSGQIIDVNVFLVGDDDERRPVGKYTGEASQIFELHRRIAEGLTAALNQEGAIRGGSVPDSAPPTQNQDAFADYAQARVFLERPDVPGNLDNAIKLLQAAIARDNRFALAYAALGEAYWAQFRETKNTEWTTKAQAANLDALRIDPSQAEVRMALAVMYEGLGRVEEAAQELRQVMALQPRNDSAHLVLARMLTDKGKWDEAVAEAKTAISLRPAYWRNHAQLGDTLLRAGRLEDAMAAYGRLIELQPDSPRGFQRLGTVLQAAGRHDEALENYEKATAIRPSWATYSNMGTLYYWREDYARAADAYERAIALAPNEPQLYGNLGDALQRLGRRQQAIERYRRASEEAKKLLAVKDNDPVILASLALAQAKLGDRAAAAATIGRAAALSPQDGNVLYVRGVAHALAGDSAAACADIRDALAHGNSAEVIRHDDELRTLKGCPAYDAISSKK